jgi:CBS domain-containing protein
MNAKSIMTTPVVTVGPETDVREIAKLMLERHISGVPVVDGSGRVLGVVSEGDLVRRVEAGTANKRHSWWLDFIADPAEQARDYVKAHAATAKEVMSRPAIVVDEDATLNFVAEALEKNHIKRVPVVRNGRVTGIISRANIVQLVAAAKRLDVPAKADDDAIREQILATLKKQPWAAPSSLNVTVQSGVVELWGAYASDDERDATRVAIENVAGVKRLEDHRALRTVVFSGAY